jgi:hypothetical protein
MIWERRALEAAEQSKTFLRQDIVHIGNRQLEG